MDNFLYAFLISVVVAFRFSPNVAYRLPGFEDSALTQQMKDCHGPNTLLKLERTMTQTTARMRAGSARIVLSALSLLQKQKCENTSRMGP